MGLRFSLPHADTLREVAPDRYLLATTAQHQGARGDPSDAFHARALGHSEPKCLDPRVIVVDAEDLDALPRPNRVKCAVLAEVAHAAGTHGGVAVVGGGLGSAEEHLEVLWNLLVSLGRIVLVGMT